MTAAGEGMDAAKAERELTHDERIFNVEATVAIMRRELTRLQKRLTRVSRHVGGIDFDPEPEEPYPALGPGASDDKISPIRRGHD